MFIVLLNTYMQTHIFAQEWYCLHHCVYVTIHHVLMCQYVFTILKNVP